MIETDDGNSPTTKRKRKVDYFYVFCASVVILVLGLDVDGKAREKGALEMKQKTSDHQINSPESFIGLGHLFRLYRQS